MTEQQSLTPQQTFVNANRKEAARWVYTVFSFDRTDPYSTRRINELAAEGWEPFMMTSDRVLLRRDATGAADGDDETRGRASLLAEIGQLKKP